MPLDNNVFEEKQELRFRFLSMRRAISRESVEQRSFRIITHLTTLIAPEIKTVMCYMPVNHEVDILPLSLSLFQQGITIVFPRVIDKQHMEVAPIFDPQWDFEKGAYNIPEPRTPAYTGPIDLALVPGLVFDHQGYRLGYGKGYYDHFLKENRVTQTIGLAYRFQLLPWIPHSDQDIPLHGIVTEDGLFKSK